MDTVVQQVVENHLLNAAKDMEDQLDEEMHRLGKLDHDDMEQLRERRILQMKQQADRKREWLKRGHGEYKDVLSEKEFFAECKSEERLVCHFHRNNWPCKVMDKHLLALAQDHLETKFVRVHAEKSPFLTERLKVVVLPTLALIKHEKVMDYIVGFDPLGGTDDFSTGTLEAVLTAKGMLNQDKMRAERKQQQPQRNIRQSSHAQHDSDEDSDFD
ncbi:hypothetical protein WJX74_007004 [Apatococcus lobatus]|uniref:Thioredoxin domain-containing protein n=1 Tax=Apatococcus lobatus TaxID=904363 RepID=A0AAW1RK08_9CHLO